jgi:hypothetical protein
MREKSGVRPVQCAVWAAVGIRVRVRRPAAASPRAQDQNRNAGKRAIKPPAVRFERTIKP